MKEPLAFRPIPRPVSEHIRAHLFRAVRVLPPDKEGYWCPRFLTLMANRLEMGRLRYGPISVGKFDSVSFAIRRLRLYLEDGNLEHLVDAANLCLVEWMKARIGLSEHPRPRWAPADDNKEHARRAE